MPEPELHLLFSPSAAGTLRATLGRLDRPDEVLCFFDDFSFGPISRDDAARILWMEKELSLTGWDDVITDSIPIVNATRTPAVEPIVWFSRRETRSFAGFLWWLWHRGDAPCTIIDVTDLTDEGTAAGSDDEPASGPGSLSASAMERLLGTDIPLRAEDRRTYLARWEILRSEDAPFRIIDGTGLLASAPLTCFDELLLSCATTDWWKAARIVGTALCAQWEANVSQAGDIVLFQILCRLGRSGMLEWRGDLSQIATCEFRLPASPSTAPCSGG